MRTKHSINWGFQHLVSLGFTLKNSIPEMIQSTPWSSVVRFVTSDGYIYLKQTPKALALEANVIKVLKNRFHAPVPNIIANNNELNCFLMQDVGNPLREFLKRQFDITLLCKAIDQFTSIQIAVADDINIFIDMGIPDWRLNKIPDLYDELITQNKLLVEDGLSFNEIKELEDLSPKVSKLCKELSSYSIQQTIVQPDFHDNNILINNSKDLTFIDLGEVVISHPFFSLITCLEQIKKHHGINENDTRYLKLIDACFKNYMISENKKDLLNTFSISKILFLVYAALANYRLILACGEEELIAFQQGRLCGEFKRLITAYKKIE